MKRGSMEHGFLHRASPRVVRVLKAVPNAWFDTKGEASQALLLTFRLCVFLRPLPLTRIDTVTAVSKFELTTVRHALIVTVRGFNPQ